MRAGLAAVVLVVALAGCGDDAPTVVDTSAAVYPTDSMSVRFDDPVAAAQGFANFVGFTDPIVGAFRRGDTRSGEVDVRSKATGPATTVLVRQYGEDDWRSLGSTTPNIQLHEPVALADVTSPVRLRGTSTAFEANVSVEVREDGASEPLRRHYVMGGSMGEMGPFDDELAFDEPTASAGALLLFTESMEDGRLWEATVVRVRFAV